MNPALRRDLGLVLWQIRYEQRAFWRNRQRGIFTFVFPLMFLVIFGTLYKGQHYTIHGQRIPIDAFFVPGILAYGVITTTYVNMAIGTSILRDGGVLKRMQGTPLPRWAYMAARIGSVAFIVLIMSVLTLALGGIAYKVPVHARILPAVVATLLLGTATFTTLGIGITRFIKNAEAAPVVVNLTVLPLTFISGIWYQVDTMPKTLQRIADFFPMRPLAGAMQHAFSPYTTGAGWDTKYLKTLAIWAVVGSILMLKTLRQPEGDHKN